jgi:hypothetical protein
MATKNLSKRTVLIVISLIVFSLLLSMVAVSYVNNVSSLRVKTQPSMALALAGPTHVDAYDWDKGGFPALPCAFAWSD